MTEIVNNLNGDFIGTVVGYDLVDRTVDVFIPKLMPMIPENRKSTNTITNLGNLSVNIKYNPNITLKSSIKVKPLKADEPMPDIGSKVLIYFLDNSIHQGIWEKFNVNNDYQIIEDEKYPEYFKIAVNNYYLTVNKDDKIVFEFPKEFSVVPISKGKTKTFKISFSNNEERIKALENEIGNSSYSTTQQDNNGNIKEIDVNSKNLLSRIQLLEDELNELKNKLL